MAVYASTDALCTLAEVASALKLTEADLTTAGRTELLQRTINAACKNLRNWCRQNLIKAAATEYYDGGRPKIILDRRPVDTAATLTVVENGTTLTKAADGSDEDADGASPDYFLLPEEAVLERHGQCWESGRRIVTVTYTAGWMTQTWAGTAGASVLSSVTGPEDLKYAAILLTAHLWSQYSASKGRQFEDGDEAVRTDRTPRVVTVFAKPYRNENV